MLTDSASLGLAAVAAWLARRPPSRQHTYGLGRVETLAALFNVLFMALVVAAARALPALIGHETPSQIVKAGARWDLHRPPADFAEIKERAQARA